MIASTKKSPAATSPGQQRSPAMVNVGRGERWINIALGTGLIAAAALRRSWGGLAMAIGGGVLLYRGVSGQCSLYRALGVQEKPDPGLLPSAPAPHLPIEEPSVKGADLVAEASAESFPASDAPVWTSASVGRGRVRPIIEN